MNNQWENTWLFIGYCHYSTKHCRNEKGTGTETCTASVSGIVTGDAPVSYWSIFLLSLATEVFAKVHSAQFPSRMADCSNTAGEDAMRYITQAPHPSATGTVYLLFQASLGIRSWLDIFRWNRQVSMASSTNWKVDLKKDISRWVISSHWINHRIIATSVSAGFAKAKQ